MDLTIKYQPKVLSDIVLPSDLREKISTLSNGNLSFPYLFVGQTGVGKTITAKVLREESYFLNCVTGCSDIDLRQLELSISSVSLSGERRMVILDDADHMTPKNQLHLKSILDRFTVNNDFIMTAAEPFRLRKEIRSRVQPIDFEFTKSNEFREAIFSWLINIAKQEGHLDLDPIDVTRIIAKSYPDFRKMLRSFQEQFLLT
jgi:DNA polymerase III delta prime subunit